MDIKALLGEQYREDMTLADIESAFAGFNLVDPSTLPKPVDKSTFEKTASELAAIKKQLKDKMTDEEQRADREREQQELFEQLKADKCRLLMEKEFAAGGFKEEEWLPLIETYRPSDSEQAVSYAKSLVALRSEDRKAIEQQVREEVYANMPRPNAGTDDKPKKNLTLTEMMALANEGKEQEILKNFEQE